MKTAEEYYRDIEPLIENGWYQAAISAFEQLLQTHPDFSRGHYELGTMHYKSGAREKVLECYKRAVGYDPDNIDYLKSLADFYHVELEQIEPALGVYKKIIEKGADDAETLFIAANLCVAQHQFEDAVNYYQKVLEIEPWHSEAFEYLEKIKNHQAAAAQVVSPEELYQKSQEAGAASNDESAVSILEQLVGQYPDYAVAHNDLGVYYQRLGNEEKAFHHFRQAVHVEPHNNTFGKNLADFLYAVKGEVVEALKIYLNVLKRDPDDTEVLIAAGYISKSVNNLRNAEIFFNRVLEIEPWNLEASENLEKLRQDSGGETAAGY
jgi:tetratricopeptide (TPR) repeat protein